MNFEPDELDRKVEAHFERFRQQPDPKSYDRILVYYHVAYAARQRGRRRLTWALGVVTFLASIGFVPVPLGPAKGAWAHALAAAREVAAVHVQVHDQNGQLETDEWIGADGFKRKSTYQNGRLKKLNIIGHKYMFYDVANKYAEESIPAPGDLKPRNADIFTKNALESIAIFLERSPQAKLSESRTGSLWGGTYHLIQVEGIINYTLMFNSVKYSPGDNIRIILKTDPASGRILETKQYKLDSAGAMKEAKYVTIEWDVEAPPEFRSFFYPPGTKVIHNRMWQDRTGHTIATARSQHWQVSIHAVDVNRSGDVYLTISRNMISDITLPKGMKFYDPEISAVDSTGVRYVMERGAYVSGEYRIIKLIRQNSTASSPRTIILTFDLAPSREQGTLVFRNIPLPRRGGYDDLTQATVEEVQY